jgi:hypothetical protein
MSDEEVVRNQREMFYDRQFEADLEAVGAEAAAAAEAGGDLGDLGAADLEGEDLGGEDLGGEDLGADIDAGEVDLGGDEGADDLAGDESALLAAPGNRNTPVVDRDRSKGKVYTPVTVDKRNIGARHRSTKSQWSDETARNTPRNISKGWSDGVKNLTNLTLEENETIYNVEEKKLFEVNHNVRSLITELEKKDNEKN